MNCPFCQKETIKEVRMDVFGCTNHPTLVFFFLDPTTREINITSYGYEVYELDVPTNESTIALYKASDNVTGSKCVMALNLPNNNINPDNAIQWIERLLNLRVFS